MSEFHNLKLDRLHQLINVNLTVTENYDNFEVVLQRLLHAIEIITNCEVTSFLLYDNETKNLTFKLASGQNTHELIGLMVPYGKGIAHAVAREKKGQIVNNMNKVKDKHFSDIDKQINFTTKNLMAFPLLDVNGEIIGIIEACNKKNGEEFTNDDYQILLIFCQHAERSLRHTLNILALKKKLSSANKKLTTLLYPDFIYASKETETKVSFAKKIAPSDSRVLIHGEKGTGKTNLATQIFRFSNRHDKALEYLNCAQLFLMNEKQQYIYIFGARKNSKMNIRNDIDGVIELANEGTIIFQEIGHLSLSLQEKIIRLIRFSSIKPYGIEQERSIDVRILATTSLKIDTLVEQHIFSEELFYRLNSVNIHLSPLHERKDDIIPLAQYFFKQCINASKKVITTIEPKIFYILKNYAWPNNVIELYNAVQRAVWNCDENTIRVHHVSLHTFENEEELSENKNSNITSLQNALNYFKKRYIYKSLMHNNWNHTKTAKILNIQRSYLSKLVKVYDLKSGNAKNKKEDAKVYNDNEELYKIEPAKTQLETDKISTEHTKIQK